MLMFGKYCAFNEEMEVMIGAGNNVNEQRELVFTTDKKVMQSIINWAEKNVNEINPGVLQVKKLKEATELIKKYNLGLLEIHSLKEYINL